MTVMFRDFMVPIACVYNPISDKNQQRGATSEDERENKRFNGRVCLSAKTSTSASAWFHFPNILPKVSFSNCASFLSVFVEVRDIYEVGFSLPSANLYEPTTPPPSGEVSQGRTAGKGGHVALAAVQLAALLTAPDTFFQFPSSPLSAVHSFTYQSRQMCNELSTHYQKIIAIVPIKWDQPNYVLIM